MQVTFSKLTEMRSAYEVSMIHIVLYLIILHHGIFLHGQFHYLVGNTICCTKRNISFHDLYLRIFTNMHQAAGLRKNAIVSCVSDVINVYRMFSDFALFHMSEYAPLYKSSIQCIDTIFQVITAMIEMS